MRNYSISHYSLCTKAKSMAGIASCFKNRFTKLFPYGINVPEQRPCDIQDVGETARNLETRVEEHADITKTSEPARHIKSNPYHIFTFKPLCTVSTLSHADEWLKLFTLQELNQN